MFPVTSDPKANGFFLLASCTTPLSQGFISLNVTDVRAQPLIQPNYLSHPRDVLCIRQGKIVF